jgi:multiple sugar transport system substrate-binding protein
MSGRNETSGRRLAQPISRRRFLYGAAAALGGVAVTGCGVVSGAGTRRTVDFWNLFGGGDGARLDAMESDFRENHPEIQLDSTTLSWGAPYYTKLSMSAVGGRPPEVAILHQTHLAAYAPAGLLEPLDPQLLSEFDIGPDKFLPDILESSKYEGEIYTIPHLQRGWAPRAGWRARAARGPGRGHRGAREGQGGYRGPWTLILPG